MKKKTNHGLKIICLNRKASFNYFFQDLLEAGIVLKGSEIKSIRDGKVNIADSYAIEKNIPIVVTNMIRHIDNKEIENMQKAIDLSTHIKIRLYKESSKYKGEVSWLLNLNQFSYIIDGVGLSDNTEDF